MDKVRIYLLRHGTTMYNKKDIIQGHLDIPLSEEGISQAQEMARALIEDILRDGLEVGGVYSSDLLRARRTAEEFIECYKSKFTYDYYCSMSVRKREEFLSEKCSLINDDGTKTIPTMLPFPVQYRRDLREIMLGPWEGKSKKQLLEELEEDGVSLFQKWLDNPKDIVPQGAESMPDFYVRCISAMSDIISRHISDKESRNIAIFIFTHGGALSMVMNYIYRRTPENFIKFGFPNAGGVVIEYDLNLFSTGQFQPDAVISWAKFPREGCGKKGEVL